MIKAKNLSGDIYIYNAKNVYEFKSKFNIPVKMLKMFSFNNQNELENTVLLNENEIYFIYFDYGDGLKEWVDKDKLSWALLSFNYNAIHMLENNLNKINWSNLCKNPNAYSILKSNISENLSNISKYDWKFLSYTPPEIFPILEKYPDKINWDSISSLPEAIPILEKNLDKVNWLLFSKMPEAIPILEKNLDKVDWNFLSMNSNAIHILENNLNKISWSFLSKNSNAYYLLKNNIDKINWNFIVVNSDYRVVELIKQNIDKLSDWAWRGLCSNNKNKEMLSLLETNLDKVSWDVLSRNDNDRAIDILEKNVNKIEWMSFCYNTNPKAIDILENNINNINWDILSLSDNPHAIRILEKNIDKINWRNISKNPLIFYPNSYNL